MTVRKHEILILLLLLFAIGFALPNPLTQAQAASAPTNIPIEFIGTVESLNPGLVIVDQLPVNITAAAIDVPLQPGQLVRVRGVLQPDGSILAEAIEVVNANGLSPTPLPQATPSPVAVSDSAVPDPLPIIVLEGEVEAVHEASLTVNGLNFILERSNPVLTTVRAGDIVRIEGLLDQISSNVILIPTNIRISRNMPALPASNVQPPRDEGMGMGDDSSGSGMGMGD